MDWDKLRIFHSVAEAGSLTHAGDALNLSQSAVSRQIRALEDRLSATLFHRHARGLILTEQGEILYDASKAMTQRLAGAVARIHDAKDQVMGELRVTTTIGFGSLWLAPRLHKLYSQHPDLKIDLMLEERLLDLPMREADVAIRMKEPSQADLIRKRLMTVNMRLYATDEYLGNNPTLETPADLTKHRVICQNSRSAQVSAASRFSHDLLQQNVQSTLTVNNYFGVLQTTLNGLGVGVLPDYVTRDFPALRRVLPDTESADIPVFIAFPEELRQSKRIAAFRDFIVSEIQDERRRQRASAAES